MKKLICFFLITTLLLGGCNSMKKIMTNNAIPETMPVNKYTGQDFQPRAEKNAIQLAKKHKEEFVLHPKS